LSCHIFGFGFFLRLAYKLVPFEKTKSWTEWTLRGGKRSVAAVRAAAAVSGNDAEVIPSA
jgi:hypothetical protein